MSSAQSTAPEGLRQFPRAHGPLPLLAFSLGWTLIRASPLGRLVLYTLSRQVCGSLPTSVSSFYVANNRKTNMANLLTNARFHSHNRQSRGRAGFLVA